MQLISVFNQIQDQEIKKSARFNLVIGLDNLKDNINKLDNLDKSKKSSLINSLNKLYKNLRILTEE